MAITASELIKQLEDVISRFGDVPVYRPHGSSMVVIVPVTHVAVVNDPDHMPVPGEKPHMAAVIK